MNCGRLRFPPLIKIHCHDITALLLKLMLNKHYPKPYLLSCNCHANIYNCQMEKNNKQNNDLLLCLDNNLDMFEESY